MTNVYEDDKQVSNPFLFLISLGRQSVDVLPRGEVIQGDVRSECVALPEPSTETAPTTTSVDAEIVE